MAVRLYYCVQTGRVSPSPADSETPTVTCRGFRLQAHFHHKRCTCKSPSPGPGPCQRAGFESVCMVTARVAFSFSVEPATERADQHASGVYCCSMYMTTIPDPKHAVGL
jgi:hypothetical protein